MPYDLRREPFIPWRRQSGAVEWGPPATLVDRLDDDPFVALAAPRPDFDGALQEFLIGLLAAALLPADETEWRARWKTPPSVTELQAALDALPSAFDLDGDGPRFFQDFSDADCRMGERWSVESLLIGTPGSTSKDAGRREVVTDLFVKPGRTMRMSRPAAAMALLTMQTYAPEGGRGHLTSMRGGGPLTTLVEPRVDSHGQPRAHDQPLWRKLWANVETREQWSNRTPHNAPVSIESAFPWLRPTRASDPPSAMQTMPEHVHALQAYFGLPRRIRLEFGSGGRCDLTGREDESTVAAFWMRAYGTRYVAWRHPLSPYYRTKSPADWLPVHGQPNGIGWRDWLGLTLSAAAGGDREPAATVSAFNRRAKRMGMYSFRLHAFGFDTKQNKARGWTEAAIPAFAVSDERRDLMFDTATSFTHATGMASTALLGAVKTALFQSPDDAPGDFGQVRLDLWAATEREFYATMEAVASAALTTEAAIEVAGERRRSYATALLDHTATIFDRWCPGAGLNPEAMRRRVRARYDLLGTLRGHGKLGEKLFSALGVALPGGGHTARPAKPRSHKEVLT